MNKNFLEHYMKTKPETMEQKYLFLVDEQEIAFVVIAAGYYAVALLPENEQYCHMRPEWAIVSPEEFQAVQAERQRRRQIAGKACGTNRNTGPTAAGGKDGGS